MDAVRTRTRRRPIPATVLVAIAFLASCASSSPAETSEPARPADSSSTTASTTISTSTSTTTTTSAPPVTGPQTLKLSYEPAAIGLTNEGDAPLNIQTVSTTGGVVMTEPGRSPDDGKAARFPAFDPAASAPRAIYGVTNTGSTDRLDPGTARFEFGTDATLDATSADLDPSSLDDGDNLLQRGRYDDVSQWKLEIDLGQPICRVKGRSGDLTVVAGVKMLPDRWYRLVCVRDGDRLTARVGSWAPDGTLTSREFSRTGPTGDVAPATAAVPLSIGGKLGPNGPAGDADQFNGRLDNTNLSIS